MSSKNVVLLEGDGIGPEITEAVLFILKESGADISWQRVHAGEKALDRFDETLPEQSIDAIREAGVALKAPIATPIGRATDSNSKKQFRSVNVRLRQSLSLYANVRPVLSMPHVES